MGFGKGFEAGRADPGDEGEGEQECVPVMWQGFFQKSLFIRMLAKPLR